MSESDRAVRVLVMGTTPESPFGGMATAIAGFLTVLDRSDCEWRFVPTHDSAVRRGKVLPWILSFPRLVKCRFRFRPDVVWIHSGAAPSMLRLAFVAVACRVLGVSVLWHLHCPTVDWWLGGPLRRGLFRAMTAGASRFAVVVPWWVDRLSRAGIAKQAIAVPNVVERSLVDRADEPPASSGGGTCVFFTACRLVDGKGVSRLLRASAKCAQPLRLVIAGDGPKRAELESLAKDLDLQDQVEFAGWLDKVQLQSLRDRSDVFVLVSTLDSFGMGYIEAAASGIPAIGAHWQAIPDVVAKDEVGLLVDPTDLGALAAAMDRLAADADLRAVLGMRGQESVHDRWSPESRVRLVQDVLSQTAGLGSASDGRLLW